MSQFDRAIVQLCQADITVLFSQTPGQLVCVNHFVLPAVSGVVSSRRDSCID